MCLVPMVVRVGVGVCVGVEVCVWAEMCVLLSLGPQLNGCVWVRQGV